MPKSCKECGAPSNENAKFCVNCGARFEESIQEPRPIDPVKPHTPPPAPSYTYQPPPQKKSNTGLIALIIIIVVVIVVVGIIAAVLFMGGGSVSESQMYGTWDVSYPLLGSSYSSMDMEWSFYENNSLKMVVDYDLGYGSPYSYTSWTTWSINNGKLYFTEMDLSDITSGMSFDGGFTIEFSGSTTINLKYNYSGVESTVYKLEKK